MAKELFALPDSIFYSHIEESLKAGAGYMLTSGYPAKEVENQKRIMTLTLVTSRMKYLEAQSNN
jgi:hypothetical protein